ncbi:hypothetical protein [Phaeobacter italicus]|uniref:hypothetical protein n=1 Tax=Phaeobacter italicus TaxID=481446 RepID=UPI002FDD45CF
MSDDHDNRKERRSSFFIATFHTVAACIYLWVWLFNGLDMGASWVGPFGSILFGFCAILSWLWHVKTLPPATQEKIMPVIGWAATAIGFGWIILGVMMVVVPLFQQGQAWLEFGEAPPHVISIGSSQTLSALKRAVSGAAGKVKIFAETKGCSRLTGSASTRS